MSNRSRTSRPDQKPAPAARTLWYLAVAGSLAGSGCATLQQFAALRQVDFRLASVNGGRLAGVDLSRVRSYSDLSGTDLGRLALAAARREMPLEFTVNIEGLNPAENKVTARMVRLQWVLLLQDKETISGVLAEPIAFPPGQPAILPMTMQLDLFKFFSGSARDLVNIALDAAGPGAQGAKVSLRAVPTIDTPLGRISYPTPITIVSRTFGGS